MGASSKLRRQSVAIDFAAAGISFATVHETSPRLHADRVAGGHCHHRHSGRPAVAGAGKAKGQEIYCLNNIKQLTLAAKMYSGDNGDRFAWTFTLVGSQQNRTSWFNYLLPYQETKKTLRCPSKPFKTKEMIYNFGRTTNNYAANFRLGGCNWPGVWEYAPLK
jgi:hypothetical protein